MIKKVNASLGLVAVLVLAGCSTPNEVSAPEPAEPVEIEETVQEEAVVEEGTRENPVPIGTQISSDDWTVTINSVNLDANDLIVDDWNEPPAEGNTYIMVEATVTYTGNDPQGEIPFAEIDYVTAEGNTIPLAWVSYEATDFTLLDPLYEGASHTGSNAYEVPASVDGVLAVQPDMFSEKTFVAIR